MKKLNHKKRGSNFGVPTKTRSGFVGCQLSLVLTVAVLALPQAGQAGWFRTYGGSGTDEGRCVQEVEDGYIITGTTRSYGPGNYALWLFKTDTIGNTIWSKTYAGTDDSSGLGEYVRSTSDGGYIIVATLYTGFSQIWLVKTDKDGDTLWTRNYGRSIGYCVQETNDGGYIVTGRRNWDDHRLFLLKTDSKGDSLWMRTYLLDAWPFSIGYFVEQTEDAGYIVAGMLRDTSLDNQWTAFWLVKTDSLGDTLWTYSQGSDYDNARCVRQTEDNGYVAIGTIGLLRLNSQGDTIWSRWSRDYSNSSSVDVAADGGFILIGDAGVLQTASSLKAKPDPLWLLKTNNVGDSLWKQFYSGGQSFYLEVTSDSGFIATGLVGSNLGDLFLLKTDSLGLLEIQENPIIESDNGWNTPHSIGSYVVLQYQGLPQGFRANVFDVSGRKVDQIRGDGNEGAMTWGINFPPGVYLIQAECNRRNANGCNLKTVKVEIIR